MNSPRDTEIPADFRMITGLNSRSSLYYAASLARMIKTDGEVWALSMRTKFTNRQPYDSTPEEYRALMSAAGFICLEQEAMEPWSHQRRKGRETLVRLRYEG
jgi:hypothetical protein